VEEVVVEMAARRLGIEEVFIVGAQLLAGGDQEAAGAGSGVANDVFRGWPGD